MIQEDKLKEAQRLYETANADQRYVLERLFPELKESEDEKIKKDFISIPFVAYDSELVNETITIPDGCVATIEGNKIHIKKK